MPRFKRVYIEITNCCNLSCDFCPSANLQRSGKMMSIEEFQLILKQVQPYTKYLYFHLLGEPLLNPNLGAFLKLSEAAGMQVNLTTNGFLIEKVEHMLMDADSLRQVNFSIHSFEANQTKEEIQAYIQKIAHFIKKIQSKRLVYCSLRLWNMDTQELQRINSINQRVLKWIEIEFQLDFKLSEHLQEKNQIKLKEGVFLHMAEKFEWPTLNRDVITDQVFCHGLRDHFAIQANGTVVPCCLDSEGTIPLGNIFETRLIDILEGERVKKIYEGFSRRCAVEELCKRCGYATRF